MTRSTSLNLPPLPSEVRDALRRLRAQFDGDIREDDVHRALYATDASLYEVTPLAVALPASRADVVALARMCRACRIPLTPRGAGTSLAGQTVGPGVVVDLGRYMNAIVELDAEGRTARVEPGVIRDDLNRALHPHGLLFGPDTSTSNRCMLGGMIGNNSCGSQSIRYGQTRDHLASVEIVTLDGAVHEVGACDRATWRGLRDGGGLLGAALGTIERILAADAEAILAEAPKASVRRRNMGYPLDDLANSWLGTNPDRDPDLARFLCGTEGTLAFTTAATLTLDPLPGATVLVAAHFTSVDEAMHATVRAVRHDPSAVELMDKRILDLSRLNPEQDANRWFIEGDPGAVLVIEFDAASEEAAEARAAACQAALEEAGYGYAFPRLRTAAEKKSAWELRKAGLGVLMGKRGDVKPITIVEDTAVAVDDLPAYIRDFAAIMAKHRAECVYYAHASVGEIHLRPELNPKDADDVARAKAIASDVADLVRDYRGSISGEHGDGRLRGPYLAQVMGSAMVERFAAVKRAFDPERLLNPGSLLTTTPMDEDWRFHRGYREVQIPTEFSYERFDGFQRAVEACNGAGVCRRPAEAGGTMCPSYMATREERDTTRGRANLFRLLIQRGPDALFSSEELGDALELCLSCKGCKRDCPASVDMATLKAEYEQGRMDRRGVSPAAWAFANVPALAAPAQWVPGGASVANALQGAPLAKAAFARAMGVDPRRKLPDFAPRSAHALLRRARRSSSRPPQPHGRVLLFVDEFTDRYDPHLAVSAFELLRAGGYEVITPRLKASGRGHLSKGFVRAARALIDENLDRLAPYVDRVDAIVGLEPSACLTYIDEALELASDPALARSVAEKLTLVEAFVARACESGAWSAEWTDGEADLLVHGHCHQKALVGTASMLEALALPPGYRVEEIRSGCCGMAGSFGYVHHDVSMQIGELTLFPAVRAARAETILVAPGTSCRHQIADGTASRALHPVQVLRDALA